MSAMLPFFEKYYKTSLLVLLLLVNGIVIYHYDLEVSRVVRLGSTALLVLYFVFSKSVSNYWIVVVLMLLLVKDIFIQFYENSVGYKMYMFVGILAYASLVLERLPKISDIKLSATVVLITVILAAANTYTLYAIMDGLTYTFFDTAARILFYSYGVLMIVLAVASITYNNKFNSSRSLLYTFLAFSFIISDICALFAYYFELSFFYYFDRAFYLLAIGLFVNYGLNYKGEHIEQYEYRMIEDELKEIQ